jgi:P4 family phage/plasmid primase-like protien
MLTDKIVQRPASPWETFFGGKENFEKLARRYGYPGTYTGKEESVEFDSNPPYLLNCHFWAAAFLWNRTLLYSPDHKEFYEYNSSTGLWSPITTAKLCDDLHHYLSKLSQAPLSRARSYQSWFTEIILQKAYLDTYNTLAFRRSVVETLKGTLENAQAFSQRSKSIQLANGVLEVTKDGATLQPFNPNYYALHASPIAYDPAAECPEFLQLLAHLDQDDRNAIQRMAGQFLIGRNLTQKVFVLEGVSNSRKSTIVKVLCLVIGERLCTELRPEHLTGRFETSFVVGKSLLIGADVRPDYLLGSGTLILKSIVGGDRKRAELKNSSKEIHFDGNLNVIIHSNAKLLLKLNADADAWARRLVLLDFNKRAGDPDQNVDDYAQYVFEKEGAGILRWVVDGATQLMKDLAERKGFVLTPRQKERVGNRIAESDSLNVFIQEHIVRSDTQNDKVATGEILTQYGVFCRSRGWIQPTARTVEQTLKDILQHEYHAVASNKIRISDGKYASYARGYQGIKLLV